jgi:hypothetical protein
MMMIMSLFGQLGLLAPFQGCETSSHKSRMLSIETRLAGRTMY